MPRPIVPAPMTAMVFTSTEFSRSKSSCLGQFAVGDFIETDDDLQTGDEQGPANQIRFLGHKFEGLRARGRMLGHVARSVQGITSVEKTFVVSSANQLVELGFTQLVVVQIARSDIDA